MMQMREELRCAMDCSCIAENLQFVICPRILDAVRAV